MSRNDGWAREVVGRGGLVALVVVLALLAAGPVAAQEGEGETAAAGGEAGTLLAAVRSNWEDVGGKLVSLAEAIPADRYSWRPAEGVRSVSEAFMHVAGANYFLTTTFGGEMPEGIGPDLEQRVTSKDEAVRVLRDSVEHVGEVLAGMDGSGLDETRQLFGRELTGYQVLLIVISHGHEHLGQAIAYARANDVVPPWSGGGEGG